MEARRRRRQLLLRASQPSGRRVQPPEEEQFEEREELSARRSLSSSFLQVGGQRARARADQNPGSKVQLDWEHTFNFVDVAAGLLKIFIETLRKSKKGNNTNEMGNDLFVDFPG